MEYEEPHVGAEDESVDPYRAIVRALARQDPRFVHRMTASAAGGLAVADVMVLAGVLATVLLGVLPVGLGLQSGLSGLVALGVAGCLVLPVVAPLVVRALLRRVWPLLA